MTFTPEPQLTTLDGTTWNWSHTWGGYRATGHVTHGIESLRAEYGIAELPSEKIGAMLEYCIANRIGHSLSFSVPGTNFYSDTRQALVNALVENGETWLDDEARMQIACSAVSPYSHALMEQVIGTNLYLGLCDCGDLSSTMVGHAMHMLEALGVQIVETLLEAAGLMLELEATS